MTSLKKEMLAEARRFNPSILLYLGCHQDMDYRTGNGLDAGLPREVGGGQGASYGAPGTEVNTLEPFTYANFDQREGVEKVTPEKKLENPHFFRYPYGLCSGHGSILNFH